MNKIDDYYLRRQYAAYLWAKDHNRSPDYSLEQYNMVKDAYERGDLNFIKWSDKDLTGFINEAPSADRREIYKYIEQETGVSADKELEKIEKKIAAVLKRGKIRDEDEYQLIHGEIDRLFSEHFEDSEAMEKAANLQRIKLKYSTSFDID